MNKVLFSGRFTKDLELRRTQKGTAVITADIAVESGWGERKKTAFPTLVIWDKSAEFIAKNAVKGTMVEVVGEYEERKWEDKEGHKRTSVEIRVEEIHILTGWAKDKAEQEYNESPYQGEEQGSDGAADYSEVEDDGQLPF